MANKHTLTHTHDNVSANGLAESAKESVDSKLAVDTHTYIHRSSSAAL